MSTDTKAVGSNIKLNRSLTEDAVSPEVPEVPQETLRDRFLKKKRRIEDREITMDGDQVQVKIQALTQQQLDDLYSHHQKRRNKDVDNALGANSETFPPALFSLSILDPKLSDDEWHDIWTSPDWSPGELGHLLDLVMNVTTRGFDPPFGGRG
jgi:hypothetical protein